MGYSHGEVEPDRPERETLSLSSRQLSILKRTYICMSRCFYYYFYVFMTITECLGEIRYYDKHPCNRIIFKCIYSS